MTDLSTTRRIRIPSFRPSNRTIIIGALAGYAGISWLIIKSAGFPSIRFRFDPTRLVESGVVVQVHLVGAVTAFLIGAILLRGVKGTGLHRTLGYTWVVAMAVTAISTFFMTGLNGNSYSFIHGLSAWTVIALPMAVAAARRRDFKSHRKNMTGMFVGGLVIAGLFSFLPGRTMWSIFFAA